MSATVLLGKEAAAMWAAKAQRVREAALQTAFADLMHATKQCVEYACSDEANASTTSVHFDSGCFQVHVESWSAMTIFVKMVKDLRGSSWSELLAGLASMLQSADWHISAVCAEDADRWFCICPTAFK